jgi:hypothetical protein
MDDQRDYAEEAANRSEREREGAGERLEEIELAWAEQVKQFFSGPEAEKTVDGLIELHPDAFPGSSSPPREWAVKTLHGIAKDILDGWDVEWTNPLLQDPAADTLDTN